MKSEEFHFWRINSHKIDVITLKMKLCCVKLFHALIENLCAERVKFQETFEMKMVKVVMGI